MSRLARIFLVGLVSAAFVGCGRATREGRSLLINSLGMTFVRIPAGRFYLRSGALEPDVGKDDRSGPVTISQPYLLATHELTNALYRRFRPDHHSGEYEGDGKRWSLNDDAQPAVEVSWCDAMAFCNWLAALDAERSEGRSYRLPTEAEWEFAATAGRNWQYPWGNRWTPSRTVANLLEERTADGHAVAAPVGSYPPNPFGVFDMAGNVWEWCSDWYGPRSSQHRIDPAGPETGVGRIVKGASWDHHSHLKHRCASRDHLKPNSRWYDVGVRVVCEKKE